ncbi:MAG: YhbY family RNA-binding protein [Azoarcus sp.]|jgi:putative YhbY family RNA-binding protein|nr:YhbY family RNA-binding protein [Azoarcus sp.]
MPTIELTPAERRDLRARAHSLRPVVTIADNGLSAGVIAELRRSLQAHELIKVRVQGAERAQRESLFVTLCETLGAAPVQHIGNILIIWRPREDEAPAPKPAPAPGNPATAKSAAAFAAAARRAALARATTSQKRNETRRERFPATGQAPYSRAARSRAAPRGR